MDKLNFIVIILLSSIFLAQANAWEVDFSRRAKDRMPAQAQGDSVPAPKPMDNSPQPLPSKNLDSFVKRAPISNADRQEFVILNTPHGFIPSQVRLRKGLHYLVHVVNVNENKKNISFMLDAFNQHYATFYGEIKTFNLDPDKEGIYDFQCPETSTSGKLVVFGPGSASPVEPSSERMISSEKQ
jgi:hypothetical protein